MKNDLVYLKHIKEAIEAIKSYVGDADFKSFSRDKKTIDAVVYQLAVIGEAASNLSSDFRKTHPEIPWRDMIDMRNVLIHEYFGVIIETVWKTVQKNLPELENMVDEILSK
jgi:uncharacterized protein with HEPN domain